MLVCVCVCVCVRVCVCVCIHTYIDFCFHDKIKQKMGMGVCMLLSVVRYTTVGRSRKKSRLGFGCRQSDTHDLKNDSGPHKSKEGSVCKFYSQSDI